MLAIFGIAASRSGCVADGTRLAKRRVPSPHRTSTAGFLAPHEVGFDRPIVGEPLQVSITEAQPLSNPWDAPFFVRGQPHVFYVTTEEELVRSATSRLWHVTATAQDQYPVDDSRRSCSGEYGVNRFDRGRDRAGTGGTVMVDPSPIERYVSEDANIRFGIRLARRPALRGKGVRPRGGVARRQAVQVRRDPDV